MLSNHVFLRFYYLYLQGERSAGPGAGSSCRLMQYAAMAVSSIVCIVAVVSALCGQLDCRHSGAGGVKPSSTSNVFNKAILPLHDLSCRLYLLTQLDAKRRQRRSITTA